MPEETVGYISELIVNYCYKGLSHSVLGPDCVNLFMSYSLLDINVLRTCIVRHGGVLTVVVPRHFRL